MRLTAFEEHLAALVVAVHPLSWLVVGGITYQQELLVTLFTLAAVGLHASARRLGTRRHAVGAVLSAALAVGSKETAIFWVPALIGWWELVARRRPDVEPAHSHRWLWSAHVAALGLALAARAHAVPEVWRTTGASLSPVEWAGVRLRAVTRSLVELVSPWLPSTNDTAIIDGPLIPEAAVVLLMAAGTWAVLRGGVTSPAARVMVVLGLTLAPALRVVPVSRFGSPHYTFPAIAALGALAALALRAAWPARGARRLVGGLAVAWVLVAAFFTAQGGVRFTDDAALFEAELQRDPAYPEGQAELGRHRLAHGDLTRAREHLEKALQPRTGRIAYLDASMTHVNLALALAGLGRITEAERHLAMAREEAPSSRRPLIDYNQAVLAARLQRDVEVVRLLSEHEGAWRTHEPSLLLARSLGRLGRVADARRALENAERVAPPGRRPAIEALRRSIR